MRRTGALAIAALAFAVLAALSLTAYAANVAQNGLVKFYTEKPSYLPNSDITIVAEFSSPFTGTYVLQIISPTGAIIDTEVKNVVNITKITYVFHHSEELYGYGVFKAVLTYSGYIVVNGEKQNVYSAQPLEITFTVAPSYSIQGKVVDENGVPVAGATVYIVETGASTVTSDDGTFTVAVKSPGTYTIVVRKSDYMSNSTVVKVESIGVTKIEEPIKIVSQEYMINKLIMMQEELSKKLDELSSKIDELTTKYEAISNTLKDLTAKVNDLAAKVDENAAKISGNSKAIEANAKAIDELKAALETVKKELNDVKAGVDDVRASLENLRSMLNEYATKNYVDTKIATEIQAATSKLTSQINDLAGRLDQLQRKLEEYATKSYVDDKLTSLDSKFTSEINSVKNDIKAVKGDIQKLKSDLDNLKSTVIQQLSQNLQKATSNANRASNIALIAVILAIIGIVIAVVIAIRLMKLTTA